MGLLWWAILVLLLGILLLQTRLNPYQMLYWLLVSLFYGLSLGSLFGQLQVRKMDHEQRTV
jgi:putative exporter of polyketide antibiotics